MIELLQSNTAQFISALGFITYVGSTLLNVSSNNNTNDICKYKELKSLMGDGVKLSRNIQLSVKQSNKHILMIAPSGIGKSRSFMMPNVNNLKNCSIICTDPSGEIERTCKTNKKKYILNPFSKETIGYDPLLNCKNEFEVRKIANVILTNGMSVYSDKSGKSNQAEWVGMATPLLTAYMLMNFHTKKYNFGDMIKNICTLPIISDVIKDSKGKVIKASKSIELEILMSEVESAITEFQSFKQVMGAVQTLSSIRTVMNSCLQLFFDSNVKNLFLKPNLDISKIRQEESIIYIQIPEHHSTYFSPLVATFLTQMFDYFLENDGLQVYYLLDEMANIGIIPSFCRLLSTLRKHSVSIVGAIQSQLQLQRLYGELEGKELTDLFKTLIICGGLKEGTDKISELLGVEEYEEKDVTKTRPLMTPDEIRRLEQDKVLIICNNKRPVLDKLMDIVI